jgi:hypothetical protein
MNPIAANKQRLNVSGTAIRLNRCVAALRRKLRTDCERERTGVDRLRFIVLFFAFAIDVEN